VGERVRCRRTYYTLFGLELELSFFSKNGVVLSAFDLLTVAGGEIAR
jgi:hypothetical protein